MLTQAPIDSEVQRVCSRFHFGWVAKRDLPELEHDITLYRKVQSALAQFGYELVNQPFAEWYVVRLRSELDTEMLDTFYSGRAFTRKSMALILLFYTKLVLPKLSKYVPGDQPLNMTLDELALNYGDRFRERGKSDIRKILKKYIAPLVRYSFVVESCGRYSAGPNLWLLRRDMLEAIVQTLITGISDSFARKADELKSGDEDVVEEVPN